MISKALWDYNYLDRSSQCCERMIEVLHLLLLSFMLAWYTLLPQPHCLSFSVNSVLSWSWFQSSIAQSGFILPFIKSESSVLNSPRASLGTARYFSWYTLFRHYITAYVKSSICLVITTADSSIFWCKSLVSQELMSSKPLNPNLNWYYLINWNRILPYKSLLVLSKLHVVEC